jgi:hypothetical protein
MAELLGRLQAVKAMLAERGILELALEAVAVELAALA